MSDPEKTSGQPLFIKGTVMSANHFLSVSILAVQVGTQMARTDVRESTRQARLNGELIPAGEGMGPVEYQARVHTRRPEMLAAKTPR